MKISFDFPIGEVVRVVEAGNKYYNLQGYIASRDYVLAHPRYLLFGDYGQKFWIEGWKLEKI